MKIIVGLGNPGAKYATTRHNAGWLFLDYWREKMGFAPFQAEKKFGAEVCKASLGGGKILIVKPQTYMNKSGESVQKLRHYYRVSPEDLLVIHDDLDLPLGTIRAKEKGGHGGHNGVRDIINHLGADAFARLKIGIMGQKPAAMATSAYVLGAFTGDEMVRLKTAFQSAEERLLAWLEKR